MSGIIPVQSIIKCDTVFVFKYFISERRMKDTNGYIQSIDTRYATACDSSLGYSKLQINLRIEHVYFGAAILYLQFSLKFPVISTYSSVKICLAFHFPVKNIVR